MQKENYPDLDWNRIEGDEEYLHEVQLMARTQADMDLIGLLADIRRYQVQHSRYNLIFQQNNRFSSRKARRIIGTGFRLEEVRAKAAELSKNDEWNKQLVDSWNMNHYIPERLMFNAERDLNCRPVFKIDGICD